MKSRTRTPILATLTLLLAGGFWSLPTAIGASVPGRGSGEVDELFSQIKSEALELEHDADLLATFARQGQLSWRTHAEKLNEIKVHVNQAGDLLQKLHDARSSASPWQQQAIDRIYPLLKEVAEHTETTINQLNDDRERIRVGPYQDFATAGYELARNLSSLLNDYVDYGDHEAEVQRLNEKLNPMKS